MLTGLGHLGSQRILSTTNYGKRKGHYSCHFLISNYFIYLFMLLPGNAVCEKSEIQTVIFLPHTVFFYFLVNFPAQLLVVQVMAGF